MSACHLESSVLSVLRGDEQDLLAPSDLANPQRSATVVQSITGRIHDLRKTITWKTSPTLLEVRYRITRGTGSSEGVYGGLTL